MPQLDTASYLPQVFWLMVVFFVFYLIVLKNVLPTLSTILKVRSKKLSQGQDLIGEFADEKDQIAVEYDNILSKSLKESGDLLQSTSQGASAWVAESLGNATSHKSSSADVLRMNDIYLQSVGEISAKKNILLKLSA